MQKRIALLGLVLLSIQLAGLTMTLVEAGFEGNPLWYALSVVQTLLWLGIWIACRGRPRSKRFCRTAEIVGLFATGVILALMFRMLGATSVVRGLSLDGWGRESAGNYLGLTRVHWAVAHQYGLALYCALRAALVPSSPRRTLLLTLAVGVPGLISVGMSSLPWDLPVFATAPIPPDYASTGVVSLTMQWVFAVAVCTVLSWVIFGLRRELQEARQFGQYTLLAKIGEGGMGAVYQARHALLRRPTAIKLLPTDDVSRDQVSRFEREVQETARLTHPNTITIFDYGRTPDGTFYYAMELLDGATAEAVVDATGPMPAARVVHVLRGVCGSLEEAHHLGLMHRDVKPANIVLARQGGRFDVPKLLDFGLVKNLEEAPDVGLTMPGGITGTPLYMAPEMITDPDGVDARADLYALGAVGYFLLTGQHVFDGSSVVEVCGHHLHTKPEPPSLRLGVPVPEALESLILGCLRKDRAERPRTATQVLEALASCDTEHGWSASEAAAWWAEHGPAVRADRDAAPSASGKTLAVAPR
ncbi:MAG: serine/threonine-protein kinase [Polyangiaceae bacterium]